MIETKFVGEPIREIETINEELMQHKVAVQEKIVKGEDDFEAYRQEVTKVELSRALRLQLLKYTDFNEF